MVGCVDVRRFFGVEAFVNFVQCEPPHEPPVEAAPRHSHKKKGPHQIERGTTFLHYNTYHGAIRQ